MIIDNPSNINIDVNETTVYEFGKKSFIVRSAFNENADDSFCTVLLRLIKADKKFRKSSQTG